MLRNYVNIGIIAKKDGGSKVKRITAIVLSFVFLFLLPVNAFAADAQKVIVTAEKTFIYESASTEANRLATAKEGYSFIPIGSTKSFWKLEFKKDGETLTGYILKADTDSLSAPVTSATKPAVSSSKSSTSSSEASGIKSLSTVYWVTNGEVYHSTSGCRSLARSSNIKSGTIAQSGKHKACKNCVR